MSLQAIHADAAVLDGEVVPDVMVVVEGERIVDVQRGRVPAAGELHVAGTLLPGPIDLQVNGAAGRGVEEASPAALDAIAIAVREGGAASFLPTLITAPFEAMLARMAAVASWIESEPAAGARPLGIHVEGPFLELAGAHPEEHMIDPTSERIDALLEAGRGLVALVTLSPDRPGAVAATRQLVRAGVCVALGHGIGVASFSACVEAGATLVTHLYNAMSPLHHRAPGMVGYALDDERVSASLILDGAHVHPAAVRLAWKALGEGRFVLVTDAGSAAGMPDGEYTLSGIPVRLEDGVVRDRAGRLAGSALRMREAVQLLLRMVPAAGPAQVASTTSANPARLLGDTSRGEIRVGARAELAWLDGRRALSVLSLR